MLEMLRERKAALEAQGKKGFTLMEMLIVIAIIAILIAIAIPVFSSQLENARDATTQANLRSAYSEAMMAYLTPNATDLPSNVTPTKDSTTGEVTKVTVSGVNIQSSDATYGDTTALNSLPFKLADNPPVGPGEMTVEFTNLNGKQSGEDKPIATVTAS